MKLCAYSDPHTGRCPYQATVKVDFSQSSILHQTFNQKGERTSVHVAYPVESINLCYYHKKLAKGYLYDSRKQSPNNAAGKREAAKADRKKAEKNNEDLSYPPAKQNGIICYGNTP